MTTGFGGLYVGEDGIDQYGCVLCQRHHYADETTFATHLPRADKHGVSRGADHRFPGPTAAARLALRELTGMAARLAPEQEHQ